MNSPITILNPIIRAVTTKTLLAQDGFTCSLLTLERGVETSNPRPVSSGKQLLVALEGEVTVRLHSVNTILTKDQAMLIRGDEDLVVVASSEGPAKVLRVDIPPRQDPDPQILGFDR